MVESIPGYIVLEDGTFIVIRVVIGYIKEVGRSPVGPNFGIAHRVFLYVEAPEELKAKMRDKPIAPGDVSSEHDIWEEVAIKEKRDAYEACLYRASDGKTYKVGLRLEPAIVARTTRYRDANYNPIYFIRWNISYETGRAA